MSSLFIFLNKTCFNGLYRVNSNGEFNVPFGKAKSPTICDADNIRALNKVLQKVTILNGDFENVIKSVKGKAFFYFDPPYRPLTQSAALGKTDEAWNKLFHQYDIPERVSNDGSFLITADQIKEYREPRLMAKFDHRKNLPAVFQEHELGILPISRGDYVIGPYKMFFPHPDPSGVTPPDRVSFPGEIESVTPDLIASEAVALNCAWDSRILHRFLGEDTLYPTLSGRMGANPFSFNIQDELGTRNSLVSGDGAQIEVDAAYEGTGSVAIIEAKMNLAEDFIVRQLYYPFRHFMSMHISKPIRTVYLTYSDGKFHLAEYAFANPQDYNSLSLVKSCSYIIGCASMPRESLLEMLEMTTSAPEPKDVPFPQADTFERVINLCERLAPSPMSKEDIEECYGFDRRQADYYYNAAAYLGFAKKESGRGSRVVLTPKGRHWTALPVAERIRYIVWCILCHEPFRRVLRVSLSHGTVPECEEIRNILIDTNPSIGDVQGNTFARRASTVRHWTQWIMSHMDS